jgi:hypothetical protein
MLGRVKVPGWGTDELLDLGEVFIRSLRERFYQLKELTAGGAGLRGRLDELAASRDPETNPVRIKWERCRDRFLQQDVERFADDMRRELHRRLRPD